MWSLKSVHETQKHVYCYVVFPYKVLIANQWAARKAQGLFYYYPGFQSACSLLKISRLHEDGNNRGVILRTHLKEGLTFKICKIWSWGVTRRFYQDFNPAQRNQNSCLAFL